MIPRGPDHARTAGLEDRIEFETVPAESSPFAAGTFELVLSTLSAHHWADPTAAINEQVRVLRPGGQLRIYDLRREGLEGLLRSWHRQWVAQSNTAGGWPESWDHESDA